MFVCHDTPWERALKMKVIKIASYQKHVDVLESSRAKTV